MNNNDSNINALGEKIRTIFYFVDDLEYEGTDGYKDMCQKGQIELRTIVFARKQRAIYKGGDMYCPMEDETFKRILLRMLDDEDVIDALIQFIKKHRNNLPIASREELGAIMVGLTLNIAENGTLDINEDAIKNIIKNYINDAGSNDIPKASRDQYGVVKIGDGINVDNGVISVKFNDLPSTTQDELLNLIYQFFQNKSNLRASTTQYGVVKIDPNGGILVNDGVISVDSSTMLSQLDQSIVSMTATRTGDQNNIVIEQNNNNNSPFSVDITSLVQNIINNTEGGSVSGLNYAITDFVSNGTMLTISQNNNTDKSVNIEAAVKQSIQNFIDNGDTIINNFGEKTQVSVDQILTSGTPIATITVDNNSTTLYAPTGSGGGGDNPGGGGSEPYDDSEIRDAIDDLLATSRSESERLDNLINTLNNEIQDKVEDMFNDAEWIQNNWPEGKTTGDSNFGEDDVESYLQRLGFWTTDENGNTVTQWSKIQQDVDAINLAVNALSSDGEITETLQAAINQSVRNGVASLNLSTTYAKADDTKKVIEWLTSGFRSETSGEMTYNEILSAANNGNHSAISDLYSRVTEIEGSYVAETGLNAKVDDAIAGIKASTDGTYSATRLFNQIDVNSDNISGIRSYIDENGASAALLAQLNGKYAGIDVAVTKDGDGYISNARIKADDIYLDGKTWAEYINAEQIVADQLEALNIKARELEAGSSNKIYIDSSNGVYVDGTCDSKINPDGSGYLGNNGNSSAITWETNGSGSIANGAISWDTYGSSVALNIPDGDISVGDASSYSQVENNAISVTSGSHGISMMGHTYGSDKPAQLYVYSPASSYRYTPTGPVDGDCDMRKKNVVEDENISIENIADAPLFKYTLKSNPEGLIKIGSSAQYWQNVIPEAVYSDDEGYLSLNYMTINTVASLTSAKEIVKLKEENTVLKQRVEALEARLQLIENKLNA